MREFMKDNIFDAGDGVTRKACVECKDPFFRSAISPGGFHRSKTDLGEILHLGKERIDLFAK